jgi:rhomboid family GlyGly-CTERM serine protease
MDTPSTRSLTGRMPVCTLLMVGGTLLVAAFPGWANGLRYDRQAILAGQVWRLFTGHGVHFSPSHLLFDTLVLGLAGWMIEVRRVAGFGWLCLLAPWVINLALLICAPDLRYGGGLSGLATCALVFLALDGLADPSAWRWACWLTLLGVGGTILWEMQTGHLLLATIDPGTAVVCTASHLAGAVTGLISYSLSTSVRSSARSGSLCAATRQSWVLGRAKACCNHFRAAGRLPSRHS